MDILSREFYGIKMHGFINTLKVLSIIYCGTVFLIKFIYLENVILLFAL